mgnify:CR=1 FL=1
MDRIRAIYTPTNQETYKLDPDREETVLILQITQFEELSANVLFLHGDGTPGGVRQLELPVGDN